MLGWLACHHRCNRCDRLVSKCRVNTINFCYDDRALLDSKQPKNIEVFSGLWHRPIVCRNHEQGVVDTGSTRQHGMYKSLMPRNINKSESLRSAILQTVNTEIGISQLN